MQSLVSYKSFCVTTDAFFKHHRTVLLGRSQLELGETPGLIHPSSHSKAPVAANIAAAGPPSPFQGPDTNLERDAQHVVQGHPVTHIPKLFHPPSAMQMNLLGIYFYSTCAFSFGKVLIK